MADDDRQSSLDRVLSELRDPWDWVGAFIGGAVGALLSIFIHKIDLDHAIPTGALFGIGGRRAMVSAFVRRELSEKADALKEVLRRSPTGVLTVGGMFLASCWKTQPTNGGTGFFLTKLSMIGLQSSLPLIPRRSKDPILSDLSFCIAP